MAVRIDSVITNTTGCSNDIREIITSNGQPPFLYSIDGGLNYQTTNSFIGLTVGTYNIVVRDAELCIDSRYVTLDEKFYTIKTIDVYPNCFKPGAFDIKTKGGKLPIQYSIDGGQTFQSSGIYSDLDSGLYNLVIKDAKECKIEQKIKVRLEDEEPESIIDRKLVKIGNTLASTSPQTTFQWLDCDNNYEEIVGHKESSFTAYLNGSYSVEMTTLNCIDTSFCYEVNALSDELNFAEPSENKIHYINDGTFFLKYDNLLKISDLKMFDALGKTAKFTASHKSNGFTIDILEVKGIYFLRIPKKTFRILKH